MYSNQRKYSTGSNTISVAVGDFHNDTRLDIVVANYGNASASIFLGFRNEFFVNSTTFSTGNSSRPRSFVISDFNDDRRMDFGVANSGSHNIGILLGWGNISSASQMTFSTGPDSSPYWIAAGNFNNDTYLDIVVANYDSGNVDIFLGYGNGSFSNQTTYSTDSSPSSVAVDDFNNDTILDIVIANHGSNNLGILLGHGNGTFANMIRMPIEYGSHPFFVPVGDFNNDRKLDFAVANNGSDSLQFFLQIRWFHTSKIFTIVD